MSDPGNVFTTADPVPGRAHEAYSFTCMRCSHRWEQEYDIEHRKDPDGRTVVVYYVDGKRVPSPLSRLTCDYCDGHQVRIMRAGRVSDPALRGPDGHLLDVEPTLWVGWSGAPARSGRAGSTEHRAAEQSAAEERTAEEHTAGGRTAEERASDERGAEEAGEPGRAKGRRHLPHLLRFHRRSGSGS